MAKVIGIDLGTTNSCVAVMDADEPEADAEDDHRHGGNGTPGSAIQLREQQQADRHQREPRHRKRLVARGQR